jgi:putative phosphotransacetylase
MASVPIEISARHIHITDADWMALFGTAAMTRARDISQPGQFSAKERVTLRGTKGELKGVAVVGPFRSYTQVELAMTDARVLGVSAPLTESGDVNQAATITIIGSAGEIERAAAIIPARHIHISPSEADATGVKDQQIVSVRVDGPRGAQLDNVLVRVHPDFVGRLHLDTDEGNACGVTPGMAAKIIS